MGHTVIGCNSSDILYNLNKTFGGVELSVVHGSIPTIHSAFEKLGVKIPIIHNVHVYLPKYIQRQMGEITVEELLIIDMNRVRSNY